MGWWGEMYSIEKDLEHSDVTTFCSPDIDQLVTVLGYLKEMLMGKGLQLEDGEPTPLHIADYLNEKLKSSIEGVDTVNTSTLPQSHLTSITTVFPSIPIRCLVEPRSDRQSHPLNPGITALEPQMQSDTIAYHKYPFSVRVTSDALHATPNDGSLVNPHRVVTWMLGDHERNPNNKVFFVTHSNFMQALQQAAIEKESITRKFSSYTTVKYGLYSF